MGTIVYHLVFEFYLDKHWIYYHVLSTYPRHRIWKFSYYQCKKCLLVYFSHVVNDLRRWKKKMYWPFTKWLNFYKNNCSHCERIFEFVLLIDALRLTCKQEAVHKNRERDKILKWYNEPSIIRQLGRRTNVVFLFSRETLGHIKGLPYCPITLWVYRCNCDLRISLFGLLIEDWIKFRTRTEDFEISEAYVKFCRVYSHLMREFPFLFAEYH